MWISECNIHYIEILQNNFIELWRFKKKYFSPFSYISEICWHIYRHKFKGEKKDLKAWLLKLFGNECCFPISDKGITYCIKSDSWNMMTSCSPPPPFRHSKNLFKLVSLRKFLEKSYNVTNNNNIKKGGGIPFDMYSTCIVCYMPILCVSEQLLLRINSEIYHKVAPLDLITVLRIFFLN